MPTVGSSTDRRTKVVLVQIGLGSKPAERKLGGLFVFFRNWTEKNRA